MAPLAPGTECAPASSTAARINSALSFKFIIDKVMLTRTRPCAEVSPSVLRHVSSPVVPGGDAFMPDSRQIFTDLQWTLDGPTDGRRLCSSLQRWRRRWRCARPRSHHHHHHCQQHFARRKHARTTEGNAGTRAKAVLFYWFFRVCGGRTNGRTLQRFCGAWLFQTDWSYQEVWVKRQPEPNLEPPGTRGTLDLSEERSDQYSSIDQCAGVTAACQK